MELRIHAMHAICRVPFVGNDQRADGVSAAIPVPEVKCPNKRGASDLTGLYDVDLSVSHECVEKDALFNLLVDHSHMVGELQLNMEEE